MKIDLIPSVQRWHWALLDLWHGAISYSSLAEGVMASKAWQIYQFIFSATSNPKKSSPREKDPFSSSRPWLSSRLSTPLCLAPFLFHCGLLFYPSLHRPERRYAGKKTVKEKLEDSKSVQRWEVVNEAMRECKHGYVWERVKPEA